MDKSPRSFRGKIGIHWAILAVLCGGAAQTLADDLARLAPPDTMFFLARDGNEKIDKLAADTAWGKLLAEPELVRFREALLSAIEYSITQLGKSDEDETQIRKKLYELLSCIGNFPSALIVQQISVGPAGPMIDSALVCEMGDRADAMCNDVAAILQVKDKDEAKVTIGDHSVFRAEGPPNEIYFGRIGDYFVLSIGKQSAKAVADLIAGTEKKSLAEHAAIVSGRKHFGGGDATRVMTGFVNIAGVRAITNALLPLLAMSEPDAPNMIQGFISALGLDGLDAIVWESHYRDGGCIGGWFFHTPRGGSGVFGGDKSALTDADLHWIPRDASWASAFKFDIAGLYRSVLGILKKSKMFRRQAEDFVKSVEKLVGFKLDEEFLSYFGDSVTLYDTFESGGIFFSGTVAVVSVKDGEALRGRLNSLVSLVKSSEASDSIFEGKMTWQLGTMEHRGHRINFLNGKGFPMVVTPAWTICDDRLILGAYPQMVISAVDRFLDKTLESTSILTHPDVKHAREIIGNSDAGFGFIDSKAGMLTTYPFLLPMASAGVAMAQGEGIEIDPSVIPSLPTIMRHMFAEVRSSRMVSDGIVTLSYGPWPLPGNPGVSANAMTVGTAASVLLPSLSRARELSKRTVCAANMRGIGQAMYIHAMDHEDSFPERLVELIEENSTTPRQFICPSTDAVWHEHPTEKNLGECYIYIPGSKTSSDPRNVLLYERSDNHRGEGVNVLFQDSHVEFMKDMNRVKQLVKETKERLGIKKKKSTKKKI